MLHPLQWNQPEYKNSLVSLKSKIYNVNIFLSLFLEYFRASRQAYLSSSIGTILYH